MRLTLAALRNIAANLDKMKLPRYLVVRPEIEAKVRFEIQSVEPSTENFGITIPAVVFGMEVFSKVQEMDCWQFTDRKMCMDYLDGKLTEADLRSKLTEGALKLAK